MDLLTTKNNYLSPEREPSWLARRFPSMVLYPKYLLIMWLASRSAKRGYYDDNGWVNSSIKTMRALESVGVKIIIENLSVLRNLNTPCVFVANHMSTLEPFVLPCIIQPYLDVTFVVKRGLIEYPFFRHVMISRSPIIVNRTSPKEDLKIVLNEGKERLSKNESIIIFPQTTRYLEVDSKNFNTLGIKLAKRSGVPVVPIALKTDAWGHGKLHKDFGFIDPTKRVRFYFGDPLYINGNGKEEHEFVVRFIVDKIKQWKINDDDLDEVTSF